MHPLRQVELVAEGGGGGEGDPDALEGERAGLDDGAEGLGFEERVAAAAGEVRGEVEELGAVDVVLRVRREFEA